MGVGSRDWGLGNRDRDRGRDRDWDWDRESGAVSGQPKADSRDWGMEIRDSGMGNGDSGIMYTKRAVKKWSSFFHSPFFIYPISW